MSETDGGNRASYRVPEIRIDYAYSSNASRMPPAVLIKTRPSRSQFSRGSLPVGRNIPHRRMHADWPPACALARFVGQTGEKTSRKDEQNVNGKGSCQLHAAKSWNRLRHKASALVGHSPSDRPTSAAVSAPFFWPDSVNRGRQPRAHDLRRSDGRSFAGFVSISRHRSGIVLPVLLMYPCAFQYPCWRACLC